MRRHVADRGWPGEYVGEAPADRHHAERDDEGGEVEVGDQQSREGRRRRRDAIASGIARGIEK